MGPLLIFTLENVYKTTAFQDFEKNYNKSIYDSLRKDDTIKIKWLSFDQAVSENKKKPKKILINVYTNWCNSCNVMKKATLSNPVIAQYINDKFYAVDFDAQSMDSISFMGTKFGNGGKEKNFFHDFIIAALKGNIILPNQLIFNEQNMMIDQLPYFMTPKTFEMILKYLGEDGYKKTKWEDYQKDFAGKIKE